MAQNLEPSHVPQQNLRNKLRILQVQQHHLPPQPLNQTLEMNPSFQQILHKDLVITNYQQPPLTNLELSNLGYDSSSCEVLGLKDSLKGNSSEQMRSWLVPLGPFTGYSSILKSSKFLKPAQEVLEDMCGGYCEGLEFSHLDCSLGGGDLRGSGFCGLRGGMDCGWKSSKLMLMLEEVYRRYKLYCQQMQSVVASFRTVAGLGNAAPYMGYAVKVVSKYFTSLKNALLDQIHSTVQTPADACNLAKEKPARSCRGELFYQKKDPIFAATQNPVWRSQRGLPDHAVSVLKTWLFEHFLHPYPTDSEKQNLALQTGLSRTQVSNWFINARVRLWKPMVEEVHMLESQQAQVQQKPMIINQNQVTAPSDSLKEKHSQATFPRQRNEHSQSKRYRCEIPRQDQGTMSCLNPQGAGFSGSNEISLELGLQQNNGTELSWSIPVNVAQNVNLEAMKMMNSNPVNGFGFPSQHFGRNNM